MKVRNQTANIALMSTLNPEEYENVPDSYEPRPKGKGSKGTEPTKSSAAERQQIRDKRKENSQKEAEGKITGYIESKWGKLPDKEKAKKQERLVVWLNASAKDGFPEVYDEDIKMDAIRSGGHGGQNVNKVSTAVRLAHIPSGVSIRSEEERSQAQNRSVANKLLFEKLTELLETWNETSSEFRQQLLNP